VRIAEFLRLPRAERRLVIEALMVIPAAAFALMVVPLHTLLRLLPRLRRVSKIAVPPERITWAVRAVARRMRSHNCLTTAVAAMLLMLRHGHPATLRLGVTNRDGGIAAHAWLECAGRPMLDPPAGRTFLAFPPLHVE
jgi:hypothetical protein